MSQSRLSQKISLYQSIDTLNNAGCLEVLQVLQEHSDCQTMNQFVLRIAIQITEAMNFKSIENLNDTVKQIICNDNYLKKERNNNQLQSNTATNQIQDLEFPLFRLPIDIIKNTSFFLNENEILIFERCCRLFYQMVNNSSYLKQSNNFKTFIFDKTALHGIISFGSKYDYYKYCHAQNLIIESVGRIDSIAETHDQFEQAKNSIHFNYWFKNLFNSIVSLSFNGGSFLFLLNKLPLEILFDPQSNLEYMKFIHDLVEFEKTITQFDKQYLNFKKELSKHGKQIRKLTAVEHTNKYVNIPIKGPRHLETRHLLFIRAMDRLPNPDILSTIDVLTLQDSFNIHELKTKPPDGQIQIKTLRLINYSWFLYSYICITKDLIESLNLHQSLINLTIELNTQTDLNRLSNCIANILTKEHYHHLENVNLLLSLHADYKSYQYVRLIFQMLRKYCAVLKHQFKQFNVAVKKSLQYYAFEWNEKIDDKFLNAKESEIQIETNESTTNHENKLKYDQWKQQWV